VSLLDDHGRPSVVERARVCPPRGQIGPIRAQEREALVRQSALYGHYEQTVDRESAYEKLHGRAESHAERPPVSTDARAPDAGGSSVLRDLMLGSTGPRGGHRQGMVEAAAKSAARAAGSQLGRQILRGILGSILGEKRR